MELADSFLNKSLLEERKKRLGETAAAAAALPDANVLVFLMGAAKPGCYEPLRSLRERCGMALRVWFARANN